MKSTPRDRTTISLSTARAKQLHEIAERRNLKVSDLIAAWIVREFEEQGAASSYSDCVVSVVRAQARVMLKVELFKEHEVTLSPEAALSLAKSLEHALSRTSAGRASIILDMDADCIEVHRRGAAVVLKKGAFEKTMPLGLASEIMSALRKESNMAMNGVA